MSFKEFTKGLKRKEGVEGELIRSVFYSLLTSFVFLGLLYLFRFRFIEDFMSKQGFFLFFAALSYAIILPSMKQIRAYSQMPCMSGMMVGMTTGMIGGFLPGFLIASANGMFVGSVFGMALGIGLGVWNGKCCGVMGFMEGVMAGFMGGLMGAMTAFMLFNDNLTAATIIVYLISAVIMFSLNYMIYKEMRNETIVKREDNSIIISTTLFLIILTTWLAVYGPRSGVFG